MFGTLRLELVDLLLTGNETIWQRYALYRVPSIRTFSIRGMMSCLRPRYDLTPTSHGSPAAVSVNANMVCKRSHALTSSVSS